MYENKSTKFHLIHDMVSNLDKLKAFNARYDSRMVPAGIFTVEYEGKKYIVTVKEESKEVHINHNSSYCCSSSSKDHSSTTNKKVPSSRTDEIDGFIAILM